VGLSLNGDVDAWARVGLVGDDASGRIGDVSLRVRPGVPSIASWSFSSLDAAVIDLDGLTVDSSWPEPAVVVLDAGRTHAGSGDAACADSLANGRTGRQQQLAGRLADGWVSLDHVVVTTGSLHRTVEQFTAAGLTERRRRDVIIAGTAHQQVFFRPGQAIIELVGPVVSTMSAASLWGITLTVADLDGLCDRLGRSVIGAPRDAVQSGRRIATFRSAAGLGIPVAVMSPEVRGSEVIVGR
jgi:hypothetical protein